MPREKLSWLLDSFWALVKCLCIVSIVDVERWQDNAVNYINDLISKFAYNLMFTFSL